MAAAVILNVISMKTSLKVESVVNTTIFEKTRWRLLPFCIIVSALSLFVRNLLMLENFKNFEKFKTLIHN